MLFYCGINETRWNHHPVAPGPLACVSPVYGATERTHQANRVHVPAGCVVLQDSGAFADGPASRLDYAAALERQITHADRYAYTAQISHRASYDLLIDERWANGRRTKARWSELEADFAVAATIEAARYADQHRTNIGWIMSAQGVTTRQYLRCTEAVLAYTDPATDIFGLGGWCVTGKWPERIMPDFRAMLNAVIPVVAKAGVKRVHVWGVMYPDALGEMAYICDRHGIVASTDSSGPCRLPIYGQWGYSTWRDNSYRQPPVEIRGLERARHVQLTRDWLDQLRDTMHYHAPLDGAHDYTRRTAQNRYPDTQLKLFGEAA